MITSLLVGTLAVTWAWEALRAIVPWSLPSWLLPLVVLGFALIFSWPDWHLAAGCAGAAGVLRSIYSQQEDPANAVRMKRGIGGRMPPLP